MSTRSKPVSGWAVGFTAFAGAIMLMVGIFQAFAGLAAILNDEFFVRRPNYTYDIDITGWGWIHLIIGIIVAAAGFAVFSGAAWARAVGITIALLSAIANFFFIPVYPVWAVLIIALDVVVIWALATYTEDAAASRF
ncbi:MAG TPA: hypothetical protein VNB86_03000 [Gaiellaceae bacterium]|jgi:hypothetical protein|nr:hypothetical protein [Gaiellaceae bacterium]